MCLKCTKHESCSFPVLVTLLALHEGYHLDFTMSSLSFKMHNSASSRDCKTFVMLNSAEHEIEIVYKD